MRGKDKRRGEIIKTPKYGQSNSDFFQVTKLCLYIIVCLLNVRKNLTLNFQVIRVQSII